LNQGRGLGSVTNDHRNHREFDAEGPGEPLNHRRATATAHDSVQRISVLQAGREIPRSTSSIGEKLFRLGGSKLGGERAPLKEGSCRQGGNDGFSLVGGKQAEGEGNWRNKGGVRDPEAQGKVARA